MTTCWQRLPVCILNIPFISRSGSNSQNGIQRGLNIWVKGTID